MGLLREVVTTLGFVLHYWAEAVVLFLTPWALRRPKSVKEDVVLVTGAGSGLGRLLSLRFAGAGAKAVALLGTNMEACGRVAEEVRSLGGEAHVYKCDLSDRAEVYAVADKIKADLGRVDILVNNAGIVTGRKLLDCPDELIQRTMQVNVLAHFWTTKAFLGGMLARDHGHIITVSSAGGLAGANGLTDYCASKFAAVGFDESLRFELDALGAGGVHATVVCPYYVSTGMFDGVRTRFPAILPILDPDYVADTIFRAILTNQEIVYLPRIVYLLSALKTIFPAKAYVAASKLFGLSHAMDKFRGRQGAVRPCRRSQPQSSQSQPLQTQSAQNSDSQPQEGKQRPKED